MLRGGVTCCNDMYLLPGCGRRAYETAGMRAMLGVPVLDFPTPYAGDADAYLQRGSRRATPSSIPRCCPSRSRRMRPIRSAMRRGKTDRDVRAPARPFRFRPTCAETRHEVDDARCRDGHDPAGAARPAGRDGSRFHRHPRGAPRAVGHGPPRRATLPCRPLPGSNMKLASGIAPVTELLRRGINVALGTDGAASNNRQDLLGEMRLASLLAKVASGRSRVGARRHGPAHGDVATAPARWGWTRKRVPSNRASTPTSWPSTSPASTLLRCTIRIAHLAHVAGRECVTDVWVGGERIVANRRLTTIDEAVCLTRVRAWQQQLA